MRKQLKVDLEDTIAAISTPPGGEGAIGIVRLSGRDAVKTASAFFKSAKGGDPADFHSFTLHYGYIYDKDLIVDEALFALMLAPKSYTREDMVEINCHGGAVTLRKTLELALKNGARIAQPGEFTKRAFINGRIDLAQAEAVLDIIRSKTEASLRMSTRQLNGQLSSYLKDIKDGLLDIAARVEAQIDFPDEDMEATPPERIKISLEEVNKKLSELIRSADAGIILKEGLTCVICGRPNVGKSSLLNALLDRQRAIVTHIPGTTRDTIEDFANINGIPFKLIDTAGIAPSEDIVEREGILRSREKIEQSDLILLVVDASCALTEEDKMLLADTEGRPRIVVMNKMDLPQNADLSSFEGRAVISISAKEGLGMDKLKKTMEDFVWGGRVYPSEGVMISNLRQKEALKDALDAVSRAVVSIQEDFSAELIAIELKDALDAIGEITGEITNNDLLEGIFSKFCVGK